MATQQNDNTNKILWQIVSLVLVLVALAFYWFEWRPSERIKYCNSVSENGHITYKKCLLEGGIDWDKL